MPWASAAIRGLTYIRERVTTHTPHAKDSIVMFDLFRVLAGDGNRNTTHLNINNTRRNSTNTKCHPPGNRTHKRRYILAPATTGGGLNKRNGRESAEKLPSSEQ